MLYCFSFGFKLSPVASLSQKKNDYIFRSKCHINILSRDHWHLESHPSSNLMFQCYPDVTLRLPHLLVTLDSHHLPFFSVTYLMDGPDTLFEKDEVFHRTNAGRRQFIELLELCLIQHRNNILLESLYSNDFKTANN